jgi:hypothetical protein
VSAWCGKIFKHEGQTNLTFAHVRRHNRWNL